MDVFSAQLNEGPLEDNRDSMCCPEADPVGPDRPLTARLCNNCHTMSHCRNMTHNKMSHVGFLFFLWLVSVPASIWNNIHIEAILMMTMVAIKWIITGCVFPLNLHPRGISFPSAWLTVLLSMGKICFRKHFSPLWETERIDRYGIQHLKWCDPMSNHCCVIKTLCEWVVRRSVLIDN